MLQWSGANDVSGNPDRKSTKKNFTKFRVVEGKVIYLDVGRFGRRLHKQLKQPVFR